MKSEKEQSEGCFVLVAFIALILAAIVCTFLPHKVIPFSLFHFWKINGSLWEALKISWIPFVWGAGFTLVVALCTKNSYHDNMNAEKHMLRGLLISIWAGVAEEICFRWLIFYGAIITLKFANFILFGFIGLGIIEHVYLYITGPIANLLTLGFLNDILFNGFGWAVGAAVTVSNAQFRDGHKYLGLIGYINSWFLGMFFFYLMFHYGLPAAILVHFLYDLFIFAVRYIDMVVERSALLSKRS